MRTIKSMSKLTDPEKIKIAKKTTWLTFLDDDSFIKCCKKLVENKINLRALLHVTKYIKPENFFIDMVIDYLLSHKNFLGLIYNPDDISKRLNISIDEAEEFVKKYKKDKVTSKEGFINRHGENIGSQKFKQFQNTSALSSSDEWFKKKFGEDWKKEKKKELKKRSQFSIHFWIARGLSKKDAIKKVKEIQYKYAGVNRKYWEDKGFSKEDIDLIIAEISVKKGLHNRNRIYLKKVYGPKWREVYKKNFGKYRKRMERLKLWMPLDLKDAYIKYKILCVFYSEQSIIEYGLKDIEKRSMRFHVDHKFSIKQGFLSNIEPQIIGSIVNLEILPAIENIRKNSKCSITKEELLILYKELQNENKEN